uniref:Moesin/ezrin/radixin homolog 1 n=1 Tax=Lygus hesperus TaxID=30085 RepID=A0A0K8SYT0_LYGHE
MNMVDCEGVSLASSCTKLPHSRSAEISKTPPPGAGPKGGGKMLAIRVHMLDDNITLFQVQAKAVGRVLFEQVCKQLHLLEADYFGLEYQDHSGIRYWLDLEKQLSRQVGLSLVEPLLHFCVKFYTPDPAQLEEEFTRYLFCLQIKRDLAQGHIQCNDNTAALMASYIVQAECGDYSADDYPDHTYLSSYKFVQHQDRELEKKIMDNHKKHIGQSPAEADLNLLETARRCELYGMKMHPAKDHEGVPLNLAVAHMGISVFQSYAKIYTFSWAKVRKISFKRKRFLIKLHPDGYGYYKDVVEFFFESRNECKNLWKKCVENHGFFRCNVVKRVPRQRTRVLSRGSSFRYSGKTQKQMVEFVRENYVKRQNFQRSQSFRQSSSVHSSVATNVGGSISARPLIPFGDNSIVSVSCGSMVHVGAEEGSQSRTFQPTTTTNQMTAPRHTLQDQHTIIADSGSASLNDSSMNARNTNYNHVLPQPPKLNGTILSSNSELYDDLKPHSETDGNENHKPEILEKETKKKKTTLDRAYFIGKELLMTERTYKRDLELINLWAREAFSSLLEEPNYMSQLLKLIDPIDDFHSALLKDMEYHFSSQENRSSYDTRLSDLFCNIVKQLHLYVDYIDSVKGVLHTLASNLSQGTFDVVYATFEKNKVCYLPLTLFILKPLQRLLHYSSLLDRVVDHFVSMNADCQDLDEAKSDLMTLNKKVSQVLADSENYVQLIELSRDLVCFEGKLIDDDRTFIRQGCLTKFSQKKGYQQRMFFLLSDMLIYCNLVGQKFKVHGQQPLRSLNLEEREDNPSPNSFTMYSEKRAITVCGSSQEEKNKWIKDISSAVEITKRDDAPSKTFFSLKCSNSADDVSEKDKNSNDATPQRSNTTVHVCWHRNTSVCLTDHISAAQNQLSGYLTTKIQEQ